MAVTNGESDVPTTALTLAAKVKTTAQILPAHGANHPAVVDVKFSHVQA